MLVTNVEKDGKYKYKVFLDELYVFWLSKKELYFLKIKLGTELTVEQYQKIRKEIILPKCKRKAISYLQLCDRTENELRGKLKLQLYAEDIIDQTIEYLRLYGYLDDSRVIVRYIEQHRKRHSKRWIEQHLLQKGIRKEQISEYFREDYSEDEAIKKALYKKTKGNRIVDYTERQKVVAYLGRQGFRMDQILKVMNEQ